MLGLFENFADLAKGRNFGDDPLVQQQTDLVNHHQLTGIGDGNSQLALERFFQRDEVIAEHQPRINFGEQVMVKLEVAQVHELAAISPGNILRASEFITIIAGNGRRGLSVATACCDRFFLYYACHRLCTKFALVNGRSQAEYRQIERNQYAADHYRHDNQDNRLDQRHGCA